MTITIRMKKRDTLQMVILNQEAHLDIDMMQRKTG